MFAMCKVTGFKQDSHCTLRLRLHQKCCAIKCLALEGDEQITGHDAATHCSGRGGRWSGHALHTRDSEAEAVFYFPGCGSERLFSQVGLATQAMLWHAGVQTVLPPGYLCCGYPQKGSGQFDKAEKIITDNRVL